MSQAMSHDPNDPVARALTLFDRCVDASQTSLSETLAALRRDDPETCAALLRLLAADAQTHSFASPLRWYAALDAGDASGRNSGLKIWPDGTRLGPWRIDGILGVGGMGVVYAAQRDDGLYEREAALKTIRPELLSPTLRIAFAKERNHLARLEHASIVALYDAGVDDGDQPWIAMQRVRGEAIDLWCDARDADLRLRVGAFIRVCDAVAYAHAHGVLHQDVKPSNLLVNEDGEVKLLDFGLSALRSPSADGGFARIGISAAYAAPEVFDGAPPSVAIDVYALGVVLYRLLCEGSPYAPTALPLRSWDATTPATAPSECALRRSDAVARKRGFVDARRLSRALAGDLDAIALRCVRGDPTERYAAVVRLRDDLRAWLDRRPVEARDGDWRYRAARFVRRNALASAVTLLALAVVLAMSAALLQQRARADMALENDAILSRLFEDSLHQATLRTLRDPPRRSLALLKDAERRLRADAGGDRPQFLARGLLALARGYVLRADFATAERLLLESKRLNGDDPLVAAQQNAMLANLMNKRSRWVDAERLAMEGAAALTAIDGEDADLTRLELQYQRAISRWLRGDTDAASRILDRAIDAATPLGHRGRRVLAALLRQRATVRASLGRYDEAERDLRAALRRLDDENPVTLNQTRQTLALLRAAQGDPEEAHALAATALMDAIAVLGASHVEVARAWLTAAKTWRVCRLDGRRARIALRRAETIMTSQVGAQHPLLEEVLSMRAALEMERGEARTAVAYARRAAEIAAGVALRTQGRDAAATWRHHNDLASLLIAAARESEGPTRRALYREADALLASTIEQSERSGTRYGDPYANRVATLLFFGRIDEAERHARIAEAAASKPDANETDRLNAEFARLRIRWARGRRDEAIRAFDALRRRVSANDGRLSDRGEQRFLAHALIVRATLLRARSPAE